MKKIVLIGFILFVVFLIILIAMPWHPSPLRYAIKFRVVDCKNNALQNARIHIYNVSFNRAFPINLRTVLKNAYYIYWGPLYKDDKPQYIVYSKPLLSDLNGRVLVNIFVLSLTPFVVVKIEKEGYYSVSYFIDFLEVRRSEGKEYFFRIDDSGNVIPPIKSRYKIDESGNVIPPVIDLHSIILEEINESDEDE